MNPKTRRHEDRSDVVIPYRSVLTFYDEELRSEMDKAVKTAKAISLGKADVCLWLWPTGIRSKKMGIGCMQKESTTTAVTDHNFGFCKYLILLIPKRDKNAFFGFMAEL